MTTKRIAVIGECMIELSEKGQDVSRGFGGDTLNTSVYIARHGSRRCPLGALRHCPWRRHVQQPDAFQLEKENVHTDLIQRMADKLPGLYYIETDPSGERTFYYWRNEAAARYWLLSAEADSLCQQLSQFDYLYLSGISIAILDAQSRQKLVALLAECRKNGGKVIFDNNYRPRLWKSREEAQSAYQDVLSQTDIAFLTLDDEDLLWGQVPYQDVISRTRALGVSEIVIKRGSDACLVSLEDGSIEEVPAVKLPKESVVDTTAAGDSFSAGYLSVRLLGGSATKAAERGHLTASTVIQYRGAIIPQEAMPK